MTNNQIYFSEKEFLMNRNGQGRHGKNGNGSGHGNHIHGVAGQGQGRRGGNFNRGRGMGRQTGPNIGQNQNHPVSEFIEGLQMEEKKAWLENFKAHLTERMNEVDQELGKL
jgi:hypothetical protein